MADDNYEAGGIALVGFLLIGLSAGMLMGQTAVGVIGGLGLGFLAMAALKGKK